ncbi:MAG: hypothetical protein MRY49_03625 [Candidatus Pacebacteria bacterium]|nr:hypothetical protein [Candidatus Paceibacterota bacterium]
MDSYTEIVFMLRVLQWQSRKNASALYWEVEVDLNRLSPGARKELLDLAKEHTGPGPFMGHLKE